MQLDKTNIVLPEGCKDITIRTGVEPNPLPLKEPKSISLSGDIKAVSNFVAIRREHAKGIQQLDPATIVVTADKNARTIIMHLNPRAHASTTITASLEQSKELAQFKINTEKRYSRKELLNLLKFARAYFSDSTNYDQVIAGLKTIRFKTTSELAQENNGKGTRVNNDESHTVASDLFKDNFYLSVPLFKGFEPVKIHVEICFEVINSDLSFWLESVGLAEAIDKSIDGIFEAELANVSDFVIIYK